MELTLGAAFLAGLVSFLSPCVLPVVPAYLGQLGVVAVRGLSPVLAPAALATASVLVPAATTGSFGTAAGTASTTTRPSWGASRGWRALPSAVAFVLGFTAIFTFLGTTAYVFTGPLNRDQVQLLTRIGGVVLIVLGLNLIGVLRIPRLAWSWRPLERFGRGGSSRGRTGMAGGFTLGAVFALGWTPCIGPTLGAILALSLTAGAAPQVIALFLAYSLGLGIPFLVLAIAVDRAPAITRPLIRHGRAIEIAGGALVIVIGLAILFDWLTWFSQEFRFLWPQV
jgi:cytochrome c-type biogenesis protein